MTQRILFVCLGNICRSPTAEAVTRSKAAARGLHLACDSAGTAEWHVGKPPYGPMQTAAARRGYDLSALCARQVAPADFDRFDKIIAMDGENLADLAQMGDPAKLCLMTDFAPGAGYDAVPDPYYTRDFDGALDLIALCADGLLDQLAKG